MKVKYHCTNEIRNNFFKKLISSKMKLSILLVLIFWNYCVHAQVRQSISGHVRSTHSERPISGAHCYLKNNEHIGSITDSLGFFHLSFSKTLLYDTLIISRIGFAKKEVPPSFYNYTFDTLSFHLDQQSIVLNEILVESQGYDLKGFVLSAIASIPKNYPNKAHQLKGLYRKVSTQGKQYTRLEEAAIALDDYNYKTPSEAIRITTESFRQTKDWGEIDTMALNIFDKTNRGISQKLNKASNPLNKLYLSNFIRNYSRENAFFNIENMKKNIDHYRFELMDISISKGDTIYQIAIRWEPTLPIKRPSGKTYLKINTNDMAIVEMQFSKGFENQPLISQEHVKFEKQYGRYYPKYIKSFSYLFINQDFDDEEYDIHTFWFDKVNIKKFKKIKSKDENDRNDPTSYKRSTLDLDFWYRSPLIKKHPLNQGVRTDIEKHQPLEDQFRENKPDQ
ncbi:carboxypeptidase-like regulatory domain-containing protein [Reichenbachiella sp. MALMAid0571]|uniref:carboxypeptidase-like regulatory domain-containing protein n=1 Tax=Reichenbachiella sp. MALMAid0571 TaxID=3143939 RepID=UPI0032DE3E28